MSRVVKIGEVCEIVSGTTPKSNIAENWGGEFQWVTPAELNENMVIIDKTERTVTEKGIKSSGLKPFPKGTVLLSSRAPIGKVAIAGVEMYCNQGFKNMICSNEIFNKYLFWFLKGKKKYLNSLGRGATFIEISKAIVQNIEIELPMFEKQTEIAKRFDCVSELLNDYKLQSIMLDELVKSRFVEMFGDPVTNPMEWDVKRLKELSNKIMSGNTPKGGNQVYVEEGITFFRSQNVWKNKLDLDNIAYIDEETHKKMKKSSLKNKDILMTKTGRINTENSSLGRAALYLGKDDCANINGHVYLIRLKKDIFNEFVLFILTTNEYREYIRKVCVGGIDKRQINKEHLEEFPIILPPMELQSEFVFLLHQVNKLKSETQKAIDNTQMLLDSLIQKYFE